MNIKRFKKVARDESGSVIVLVAILMVGLLSITAVAVDFGARHMRKSKLQTACDAAALAAVVSLPDENKAREVAKYYIKENGFDEDEAEITILDGGKKIKVGIKDTIDTTFASIMGIKTMNISGSAVAAYTEEPGGGGDASGDFGYAIFSGSESDCLKLGGAFTVNGKIHSNGTMNCDPGNGKAKQYTASQGGYVNKWTTDLMIENEDGSFSYTDLEDTEVSKSDVVEMPYYLGDNMMDLVDDVSMPSDSYWDTIADDFTVIVQKKLPNHQPIKIENAGGWCSYALNTTADICISKPSGMYVQAAATSTLNGDVYIYADPGSTTTLYFPSAGWNQPPTSTINGNIYCLSGNLTLGNVTVNGNVYCAGQFSTDGGTCIINSKYVYADSIQAQNSVTISGAIIAEHDINLTGGQSNADSSSALSIYSKHGNIRFDAAGTDVHGIIFAPYGDISVAANVNVYGNVIGNTISNVPANWNVYPRDRDLGFDTTAPAGSGSGSGTPRRKASLTE